MRRAAGPPRRRAGRSYAGPAASWTPSSARLDAAEVRDRAMQVAAAGRDRAPRQARPTWTRARRPSTTQRRAGHRHDHLDLRGGRAAADRPLLAAGRPDPRGPHPAGRGPRRRRRPRDPGLRRPARRRGAAPGPRDRGRRRPATRSPCSAGPRPRTSCTMRAADRRRPAAAKRRCRSTSPPAARPSAEAMQVRQQDQRRAGPAARSARTRSGDRILAARPPRRPQQRPATAAAPAGCCDCPVDGPVTSPFGYRVHPIYHYWGLHDGTDFGAGCGQPLHAVAGGRVISEYYSSVWGNRLYLDLGTINGKNVTVDLQPPLALRRRRRRRASAAARSSAYVGTTGWSTGCHLHFTVMVNGTPVTRCPGSELTRAPVPPRIRVARPERMAAWPRSRGAS